ncbi:MAG: PBP1A family penicillin-binding protein [Steroidobacteraceae bacterium]
MLLLGVVYALLASYVYIAPSLPSSEGMRNTPLQVPLRVYTRSGALIMQIGEQRRVPVSYADIPQLVREAFLAAEDDRFFEHGGVDYFSMLRSLWVDVKGGEFTQGGSTITMQTARNMFLTKDKHIQRKLQEVFVTLRMERDFTKQQILETYLNVIFFGQRAYGVAAAAEVYFGKPLSELSVAEAAMLAGLPQAPSRYNPVTSPEHATDRRRYVLHRMQALHYIDAATAKRAGEEEIHAREFAPHYDVEAPYVAEMARMKVIERFGEAAINQGYRAITTIDGRLQTAANRALRLGLIEYDRRHGYRGALRNVPISAEAVPRQLEGLLASFPPVGNLQSAVVVSVAPTAARVYVRGTGFAQIEAEGVAWARGRNGGSKVDDIMRRGDLVYVLSNGQGAAQLAQIPEAQGALVVLDPQDGAIAALIGGFDYFSNAYNRVTQAHRQPGSGFKPFLYSAALEHEFTPASVIMDAPIVVADQGVEQTWRPENDGGTFSGPTRLREALVHSRNLVSIRLLRAVGASDVIDYAARFGFDRAAMPNNLTLALGTLTATPLQVATGYSAFANGGFKVEPYFIERIENAVGETVWRAEPAVACAACETADMATNGLTPEPDSAAVGSAVAATPVSAAPANLPASSRLTMAPPLAERLAPMLPAARRATRIITAANAWLMDDIMADVIKRGTGRRALVLGRNDLSGKTGTTNESRNTWFNGFNQNLEATVWVGFDQERPLGEGEEGSSVAVPIWVRLMREGLRGMPDVPRAVPPGLVMARVDAQSGLLAPEGDTNTVYEFFFAGKVPALGNAANTPDNGGEPLF